MENKGLYTLYRMRHLNGWRLPLLIIFNLTDGKTHERNMVDEIYSVQNIKNTFLIFSSTPFKKDFQEPVSSPSPILIEVDLTSDINKGSFTWI
jgi:hypothetical protein